MPHSSDQKDRVIIIVIYKELAQQVMLTGLVVYTLKIVKEILFK